MTAFVPTALPPVPPLALGPREYDLMERANRALGRLDGLATVLPETSLFVYTYVRKEAVLSSQIEGTQSSLSDLLAHEADGAPGVPFDDVVEVSRYVAALHHGLTRIRGGFPLSLRLIREMHAELLSEGRGAALTPGEFRRTQNWLGGTRPGNARFVPPPPHLLTECLSDLERFLHDDSTPLLIRAALAHLQFETIDPFLDGNGRLGRLLITLLLAADGALSEPILYLSLHFKRHREAYYEHLQRVREEGDWEGWLRFFLEGVLEVSGQAVSTAKAVLAMFDRDRRAIQQLGRVAGTTLQIHEALQRRPILSIQKGAELSGVSEPTAASAFARLADLGLVEEITGKQRGRVYAYRPYVTLLSEGTEPLAR